MAIPTKSVRDIKTLSGRVDQASLPYRAYMKLSCLEMEKARRLRERESASQRIANIDARLQEIEAEEEELLQSVGHPTHAEADCPLPIDAAADGSLPPVPALPAAPARRRGGLRLLY
jgi:hypothetical protein